MTGFPKAVDAQKLKLEQAPNELKMQAQAFRQAEAAQDQRCANMRTIVRKMRNNGYSYQAILALKEAQDPQVTMIVHELIAKDAHNANDDQIVP